MNQQEARDWMAEWAREKLDDLIFKHLTIGVDKATDGARAVSAVISHANELIVKQVQENHPVSKEPVMIDRTLNIGDNNVSIGNIKIKWEVGKAYRTRSGWRAIMRRQECGLVYITIPAPTGAATYYCVCDRTGIAEGGDHGYDIIGPWEEGDIVLDIVGLQGDGKADADPHDYKPVPAKPEQKAIDEFLKVGGLYKTKSGIALKLIGIYETIEHGARIDFRRLGENSETFLYNKDGTLCAGQGHPNPEGMDIVFNPDADLYDYQNGKAKAEQKAKVQYVPENIRIAGPVMQREKINDINTPDNRRPRVSLRTDAQIMHERAVLRLKQHKLARWGKAAPVRWEQEL